MDNVIFAYTDEQAVADGVLVDTAQLMSHLGIHRVTRAVWDEFVVDMGKGLVQDVTKLLRIAEKVKAVKPEDGWYIYKENGCALWCIPNELGSLTLMFPEDY